MQPEMINISDKFHLNQMQRFLPVRPKGPFLKMTKHLSM
jgi:hypothetical protein